MRATHVEAPSHEWADAEPDAVEEPPEPSAELAAEDAPPTDADNDSEHEQIAGVAHADPDALAGVGSEQLTRKGASGAR